MYREAVALFKDLEGMAARKAFDNAMADAKAEIPTIKRNRSVDAGEKNGKAGPKYRFEDLAEIAQTVDPILSKHGLSYRYRVASPINQPVTVTCVVSHRAGHFEETTLTAGRDDGPGRNAIQQVGSTITYLQRYTLKAALGLAVSHDDDARGSQQEAEPETYTPPAGSITQDQVDFIRDALAEKGASASAFLQWASSKGMFAGRKQRLEELPAQHYAASVNAIAQFKKA
ncbi:ERF family protein [Bradyrhizobium sp. McL0615]|uniref:ERF family protein n=1 Tax=Bradyrhizobium sp. McL0615 TaxID=3415673 RepID=UPI003CEC97CB